MDQRIRAFDDEVAMRFAPLAVFGLTSFRIEEVGAPDRRPYSRTISLHGPEAAVTCALVLEAEGKVAVRTSLRIDGRAKTELRSNAYAAAGMRKSIAAHAGQLEALLVEQLPR
ncbi:MAG: hypothetical protein ACT4QG_19065 [Sporichthyaceae bacterium]